MTALGSLVEDRTCKHSLTKPWKTTEANLGTCTAPKFLTEKEKIRKRLPCSQAQMSFQKVLQIFVIFFPRL